MANYRDYGTLGGGSAPNVLVDTERRSQVWQATHDGGGSRLPHRYRSFISFSYGDKWIEDFNLIAYCNGDTMSRQAYASFEDLTTSYDIMDGQYYHGTHYQPNTLSLDLVTDGIDQQQLDNFLHWFKGGVTRELVLAEHPNRAIQARVANPPQLEVLPFEQSITMSVGGISYTTSTTLYKGTISLELVSDTPFWYAKQNILIMNSNENKGIFTGKNLTVDGDLFKEALKIVYEDNVPITNMISATMHFGGTQFALMGANTAYTNIVSLLNASNPTVAPSNWDSVKDLPGYFIYNSQYMSGARIESGNILGRISGVTMEDESNQEYLTGIILPNDTSYQFFYGGTAPSPTKISFKIQISEQSSGYIDCIRNSYTHNKHYSTITIESIHTKKFDFTTPNIMTSWNKAYHLFRIIHTNGTNWKDLSDTMRDQIRHPAVRAFAISIINYLHKHNSSYINENGIITETGKSKAQELMRCFFRSSGTISGELGIAEFEFDAELGITKGTFSYWKATDNEDIITKMLGNDINRNEYFVTQTEDVGDMLHSNWLIIEDRNSLDNNGKVAAWDENSKTNAHKVSHDVPHGIIDLKIEYKNMYL